ncbi:hypothetical protein ACGFX8_38035 [Streptomyces sp. NPDC048362]|uniref:hypothetical protein n=1 Tax=Streptomyces sp. NPDC048362 TaxID=3365539 RepID=UPI0037103984
MSDVKYLTVNDLASADYYGPRLWPGPHLSDKFMAQCLAILTAYPQPIHEKIASVIKGASSGKVAISAVSAQELPGTAPYMPPAPPSYTAFYSPLARALYVPDLTKYEDLSPYRVLPMATILHEAAHAFEDPIIMDNVFDIEWPLSGSDTFRENAWNPWAATMDALSAYVFSGRKATETQKIQWAQFDRAHMYLLQPSELFADAMAQYYCSVSEHPDPELRELHKSIENPDWLGLSLCKTPELKNSLNQARGEIYNWFADFNSKWHN